MEISACGRMTVTLPPKASETEGGFSESEPHRTFLVMSPSPSRMGSRLPLLTFCQVGDTLLRGPASKVAACPGRR